MDENFKNQVGTEDQVVGEELTARDVVPSNGGTVYAARISITAPMPGALGSAKKNFNQTFEAASIAEALQKLEAFHVEKIGDEPGAFLGYTISLSAKVAE